jgi:hypothetical protein
MNNDPRVNIKTLLRLPVSLLGLLIVFFSSLLMALSPDAQEANWTLYAIAAGVCIALLGALLTKFSWQDKFTLLLLAFGLSAGCFVCAWFVTFWRFFTF